MGDALARVVLQIIEMVFGGIGWVTLRAAGIRDTKTLEKWSAICGIALFIVVITALAVYG